MSGVARVWDQINVWGRLSVWNLTRQCCGDLTAQYPMVMSPLCLTETVLKDVEVVAADMIC